MDCRIKVFVGAPSCPSMGFWITLPMDKVCLDRLMTTQVPREYIIADYSTELDINISQYSSVEKVNDLAVELKELSEQGTINLLLAAYYLFDEDMELGRKLVESGKYEFYNNVSNLEELGEAVVRSG